jgi:hypothetical protein
MASPHTLQLEPVSLDRFDERTGEVIETVEFHGHVLGNASSQQAGHRGHAGGWAPKRVKCSACRWLEVTIYLRLRRSDNPVSDDDEPTYDYVVYTVGASNVPSEIDFIRLWQTTSAFEVVELLTVRRGQTDGSTETFIPPQHARALAQAASVDDDIREAYVNRAVA